MNASWEKIARVTLEGSESGAITFPQSTKMLMDAGFDGYAVDFRRSTRSYYMLDGRAVEFETAPTPGPVAKHFDADAVKAALREAQALVPGYTYRGFCAKVVEAGCAGYMVSLLGKRVLYYGRTGETHTEYFPGTQPQIKP